MIKPVVSSFCFHYRHVSFGLAFLRVDKVPVAV